MSEPKFWIWKDHTGALWTSEDGDHAKVLAAEHKAELFAAFAAQTPPPHHLVEGWQPMETAPMDGVHVILAVKSGPFVYAVQGAYRMREWSNAADIKSEPLCWMPNARIPAKFLPWTDEFKALATAAEGSAACRFCNGRGTCADYVGLEMRCVEVECDGCQGTGKALATAAEADHV